MELTKTQERVLKVVSQADRYLVMVGGHKRVGLRNSAESLVRKGLLHSTYSSYYSLTWTGKEEAVIRGFIERT